MLFCNSNTLPAQSCASGIAPTLIVRNFKCLPLPGIQFLRPFSKRHVVYCCRVHRLTCCISKTWKVSLSSLPLCVLNIFCFQVKTTIHTIQKKKRRHGSRGAGWANGHPTRDDLAFVQLLEPLAAARRRLIARPVLQRRQEGTPSAGARWYQPPEQGQTGDSRLFRSRNKT